MRPRRRLPVRDLDNKSSFFASTSPRSTARERRRVVPSVQAMDAEYKRCISRGVSAGASPEQGKKPEADVKAFFSRAMGL